MGDSWRFFCDNRGAAPRKMSRRSRDDKTARALRMAGTINLRRAADAPFL